MSDLERHSFTADCRGAGYGKKLGSQNTITVTQEFDKENGSLENILVGCFFLKSNGACLVTGVPCPHLNPVERRKNKI